MKNWDVFIIVSTSVIALALFSSGKTELHNMLENLTLSETLIVMIKTIAIVLAGSISIALMVIVLLADILVSVVLRMDFPVMHFLYENLYLGFVRGWYWDIHSGSHIFMACIVLFGIGIINTYLGPVHRKKTIIYHKTRESNYYSH